MCDICVKASNELAEFLTQLEEKYPGQSVDGQDVSRRHHVLVATVVAAERLQREELMELVRNSNQTNIPFMTKEIHE